MPSDTTTNYPVEDGNGGTPRAAAGIVIGALVALILIRRGFRGVSVGGVNVGVR